MQIRFLRPFNLRFPRTFNGKYHQLHRSIGPRDINPYATHAKRTDKYLSRSDFLRRAQPATMVSTSIADSGCAGLFHKPDPPSYRCPSSSQWKNISPIFPAWPFDDVCFVPSALYFQPSIPSLIMDSVTQRLA